jgi:hypothetical protein
MGHTANAKALMFTLVAATCFSLAAWEWAGGATATVCNVLSVTSEITGMIQDEVYKSNVEKTVDGFANGTSSMLKGLGMAVQTGKLLGKLGLNVGSLVGLGGAKEVGKSVGKEAGKAAGKEAGKSAGKTAGKTAAKSGKGDCLFSGGFASVSAILAGLDVNAAKKSIDRYTNAANNDIKNHNANIRTQYASGQQHQYAGATVTTAGAAVDGKADSSCESKGGNDYLGCLGKESNDPQISAMISNPGFLDTLQKGLGGQSLGDYVKNYKGDGSPASMADYASAALGLPSSAASTLSSMIGEFEKIADHAPSGAGAGYASKSAPTTSKNEEVDFNKLMGGILGKLNPEDLGKKVEDPAELVFRKLDLLPAEKIEQNKDISLFARIGYRYRKKASP